MRISLFMIALLFASASYAAGWHIAEDYSGIAEQKAVAGAPVYCEPDADGCAAIDVTACASVSIGFDGDRLSESAGSAVVMPQRCEASVANAADENCNDILTSGLVDGGTTSFDFVSPGVVRGKRTVAQTGGEKPRLTINCTR